MESSTFKCGFLFLNLFILILLHKVRSSLLLSLLYTTLKYWDKRREEVKVEKKEQDEVLQC